MRDTDWDGFGKSRRHRTRCWAWTLVVCAAMLFFGRTAAGRADDTVSNGVTFQGFNLLPAQDSIQRFRVAFDRTASVRVHDALIDQHYFYLDFYNVEPTDASRDWTASGGVFHVKQIYYAPQHVLRFIFYCRGDEWFSVQTQGGTIHEIQARAIPYGSPDRTGATGGGSKKRVVIDPGHGGTPGQFKFQMGGQTSFKVNGSHVEEKEVTLQVARRLEALMRKTSNLEPFLTRTSDLYVSLEDRVEISRKAHGDLFLSIHMNAGSRGETGRGFEIYYLSDGSKETNRELVTLENEGVNLNDTLSYQETLRDLIKKLADEAMGLRQSESRQACEVIDQEFQRLGPFRQDDRGVKSAPFRVLMNFEMPAVLAECGFLDHPREGRHLIDPDVQQRIAILLFNGINRYFAMQDPEFRPARIAVSP